MRTSFLCLALLACAGGAAAQDDNPTLLGAGVRTRPEFDGSSVRATDLIPVVRYYGKPWFARTTQGILEGGARWNAAPGVALGAQLAYEQGPQDRDPGASVGLHAEWEGRLGPMPLDALARLRRHFDSERGLQADLRLTAGVYEGRGVLAGVFGQLTYASADYYRAYYRVDDSGLLYASAGALASYDLSRRWLLVGSLERRRLGDGAARSSLVARRSATYGTLGAAYRF